MQAVCTPPETVTDRTERVSRLTPLVARHTVAPAEVDVTQAYKWRYFTAVFCIVLEEVHIVHLSFVIVQ